MRLDNFSGPSDSLMFTGSKDMINSWKKIPDKLKIVKPLEGSLTLHHWQKLAKPCLEGIFEEHKGVVMKGSIIKNDSTTIHNENIDQMPVFKDDFVNNEIKQTKHFEPQAFHQKSSSINDFQQEINTNIGC